MELANQRKRSGPTHYLQTVSEETAADKAEIEVELSKLLVGFVKIRRLLAKI